MLLSQAEKSELVSFSSSGARRLADLYRRVSSDLIQARTYGGGGEFTRYLESLVGRGYALLYPAPRLGPWRAIGGFFRDRFPRTVRRESLAFLMVVAAFSFGLLLGGLATAVDPEASRLFVPAEHREIRPRDRVRLDEMAQRAGQSRWDIEGHASFSTYLFTHNIGVAIVCFAIGIAWGLPTLLLIAYHGVFIAALGVEYFRDGVGIFFLAWILPHGILELTSIFLAATSGLMLGRGVLWPRGQSRPERLRTEARSAMELLAGGAALLVFAGLIEGTLSQIHEPALPYSLKIAMAIVLGTSLHGYLWLLPLKRSDPSTSPARKLAGRGADFSRTADGRSLIIWTPEQVAFTYPLAGPVERVCAYSIDLCCIVGIATIGYWTFSRAGALGISLALIALFAVQWGYFVWFEWRWNGSTPGKQVLGIRVIQIGGVRCSFERVILRNFLRVIDVLPNFYLLGGLVMLIDRRGARLGDLAAGTVCVRVPRAPPPSSVAEIRSRYNSLRDDGAARERIRQVLTLEESESVIRLALRRELLESQPRMQLFAQYAAYLRRRLRLAAYEHLPDESLVLNTASVLLDEKVL